FLWFYVTLLKCFITCTSLGKKIMIPQIIENTANSRTAEAAASFAFFAKGCQVGETRLVKASSAVLNSSAANTRKMDTPIQSHSLRSIFNKSPIIRASIAKADWILKFLSVLNVSRKPYQANLNADRKPIINHFRRIAVALLLIQGCF